MYGTSTSATGSPWGNPTSVFGQINASTHTSYPDYSTIIESILAPIRDRLNAQQSALGSQIGFQQNLARSNAGISQAQLDAAHKEALLRIYNTLQARGLGPSGEVHHQVSAENHLWKLLSQGGANSLLSNLTNLQNQLTNSQLSAQDQLAQALAAAQANAQSNYSPNIHYNPWGTSPSGVYPSGGFV